MCFLMGGVVEGFRLSIGCECDSGLDCECDSGGQTGQGKIGSYI